MHDTRIARVHGRRVWDSRGRPTLEAEVQLAGGARGRAIAPAGASRGSREAIDLRDGGTVLGGWGVGRALAHINRDIADAVLGMDAIDQSAIDGAIIALDGSPQKTKLGGNATIAVSMAVLHAAAAASGLPLHAHLAQGRAVRIPLPEIQIFGGGAHAGRRIDIQDLMVMAIGATSFDQALMITAEVYRAAGEWMRERGTLYGLADEGGYWPAFDNNEQALDALLRAIERAGYTPGQDVAISLDIAASEFGKNGHYSLGLEQRQLDSDGMIEMLLEWMRRYPIVSIEDPLGEDDPKGMHRFTQTAGNRVQIIGDDYLVTNAALVERAIAEHTCNAVLIKPNQAGTVSETFAAVEAAKAGGFATIVSARSGETEDVTICHLATGWNAGQLKVGAFARSERMVKWNEMLRIEEQLGSRAHFAGKHALGGIRW